MTPNGTAVCAREPRASLDSAGIVRPLTPVKAIRSVMEDAGKIFYIAVRLFNGIVIQVEIFFNGMPPR